MDWIKFTIFTLISSIEYVSVIVFIAALFRFRYFLKMKMHILMVCILLSYVSYTTRTIYEMNLESSVIQLSLMTFFIWLMFRVRFVYSALMSLATYTGYGALQVIVLFFFNFFNVLTMEQIEQFQWPSHMLPITSSVLMIAISWFIIKKNLGFSFVPDGVDALIRMKPNTTIVLGVATIAFWILTVLQGMGINLLVNLYVSSVFYIVSFSFLIIYSIRRERNND